MGSGTDDEAQHCAPRYTELLERRSQSVHAERAMSVWVDRNGALQMRRVVLRANAVGVAKQTVESITERLR